MTVSIDGNVIGVGVTRGFSFPAGSEYTEAQASSLLEAKLSTISIAQSNVSPADQTVKAILFVVAYNDQTKLALLSAYAKLDASAQADTILIIATTSGDTDSIYFNE